MEIGLGGWCQNLRSCADMSAFVDMDTGDKSDRQLLFEIRMELAGLRGDTKHLIAIKDDHEVRIRSAEQNAWKQSGAIGVVTFVVSAFIAWLISAFRDGKH